MACGSTGSQGARKNFVNRHQRWKRLQALFDEAIKRDGGERYDFLSSMCAGDPEMLEEAGAMVAADMGSASVLDRGLDAVILDLFAASQETAQNETFGPYRLLRLLGEGGMGTVWLAERQDTHTSVAMKFLPHAKLSPSRRHRFAQEVKTFGKLKHPFIARFLDAGTTTDGTPWFVMEYVDGVPLNEYVVQTVTGVFERLRLFRKICEAVLYAQNLTIVHRDLKPSNILIEWDGTPKLLDFGIARDLHELEGDSEHTRNGIRFLSLSYAAPEWVHDGTVGLFTDVYSLGVILYELLTGTLPSANFGSRAEKMNTPIPRPSVQSRTIYRDKDVPWSDLDLLCLKALHFDHDQRYQSAEALLRDLDHCLNEEPLEARPATFSYRLVKYLKRNRDSVAVGAMASACFLTLITIFSLGLARSHQAERAEAVRSQLVERFLEDLFRGGDAAAGPTQDLKVVTLLKGASEKVDHLNGDAALKADLYRTLGNVYEQLGDYDASGKLINKALTLDRTTGGESPLLIADDLKSKSALLVDIGKTNDGEQLAREAVNIVKEVHPLDKARLADMTSALGTALVEGGKYEEGVEVTKQAIQLQEQQDPTSQQVSDSLTDLADALEYLGKYDESERLNQRILRLDQDRFGDLHPTVASDLLNLAQLDDSRGRYQESEQYKRKALSITRAWYGANHPETADQMDLLASTLMLEGKYTEAKELTKQALPILLTAYGPLHPRIALNLNVQGRVDAQLGQLRTAEKEDIRAAAIYHSALGANYKTAVAMSNLSNVYLLENKYHIAEEEEEDALAMLRRTLPAGDFNIGIAQARLGKILFCEAHYDQALVNAEAATQILTRNLTPDSEFVVEAENNLSMVKAAFRDRSSRPNTDVCRKRP
jgi:serine/threonine protein kinase